MMPDKADRGARIAKAGAEAGLRQPVQVIEGNYTLMPGQCPCSTRVKKSKKNRLNAPARGALK